MSGGANLAIDCVSEGETFKKTELALQRTGQLVVIRSPAAR